MKKSILFVVFVSVFACAFSACTGHSRDSASNQQTSASSLIPLEVITNNSATPRDAFTAGEIPKADLDRILQAAVRAPSTGNRQSWHFTVVQDAELAQKILRETANGNVLIVVSAKGDGKTNYVQIIDCSVAAQSINLTALALGYGARIYLGPIENLNQNLKDELDLPPDHSAVLLVRVGMIVPDAVTSPSPRNAADTMITFK
ncbi:nitroreductase family protein [Treponema sp. R80B11-R83G3]